MSKLQQLLAKLLDEGYVAIVHTQYIFTKKWYQEITGSETGVAIVPSQSKALATTSDKMDWSLRFMNLIKEAQVPARLEDNKGNVYYSNKYSEAAMKVFKKALEAGVSYPVLVKSVMLYYKSNVKYKKAIGNYFTQGDWRTDYEAMLETAVEGEQKLIDHIKNETEYHGGAGFTLG